MSERVFDYGLHFATAGERLVNEQAERRALADKALSFGVAFLDDVLRAILPHDLIILGAGTGVGKTALATIVSLHNALKGRRVRYLCLEGEPAEIERRLKYTCLVARAFKENAVVAYEMNYPDWYLGRFAHIDELFGAEVDAEVSASFRTLQTYYRGRDFTVDDLTRIFTAIQDEAELIVLDHLHYVDSDDDNENRAHKALVKRIRDLSLSMGVPILVVAHLRKKARGVTRVVPDIDDFHGSSDITKIATRVVVLAPAYDVEPSASYLSPTRMHVPKDRMGGATRFVATAEFDRRSNMYCDTYELGRLNFAGDELEAVQPHKLPRWARGAKAGSL